jgi:hypothetical protein
MTSRSYDSYASTRASQRVTDEDVYKCVIFFCSLFMPYEFLILCILVMLSVFRERKLLIVAI